MLVDLGDSQILAAASAALAECIAMATAAAESLSLQTYVVSYLKTGVQSQYVSHAVRTEALLTRPGPFGEDVVNRLGDYVAVQYGYGH
jgi:hypothetical protein